MQENFYKELIQNAPFGYAYHQMIFDTNGKPVNYKFIETNEVFENLTGLKFSEIKNKLITEVIPGINEIDFDWIGYYGNLVLKNSSGEIEQYSNILKKWYKVQISTYNKEFFTTIFTDITKLEDTEIELHRSQTTLNMILNTIPQSVFWKNKDGVYLGCNVPFAKAGGLSSPDEIIGKTDFEMPWSNLAQTYLNDDKEVLANNNIKYNIIEPLRLHDGNELWIETTKIALKDESNQPYAVLGVFNDITDKKLLDEVIEEERQRLSDIIYATNAGTWEYNIINNELVVNAKWADMLGYKLDEIEPVSFETWKNLLHPEDVELSISSMEKHINGELDYYDVEFRMLHKMGHWVWILSRGKITSKTKEGKPKTMVGIHQEISKIKESEIEFKTILETTKDGFFILSIDGKFLNVNNNLCMMLGYTEEELLKLGINDIDAEESSEDTKMRIEKIIKNGFDRFETKHIKKNRELIDVEVSTTILNSSPPKFITFSRDISSRKAAEKALLESELLLKETGNIAKIGGWKINLKNRELYWSSEIYLLHEVDSDFIPTIENAINFYDDISKSKISNAIQLALEYGQAFDLELSINTAKGNNIHVRTICNVHKDSEGNPEFLVGAFQDITDIKLAKLALEQKNEELLKAKEKAEESERLKTAFLANMSHEIRTPMNGILGFLSLLKQPNLSGEELNEYINIVNHSGNRLLETINDIIEISKIDAGQIQIYNSDVDVCELMKYHYTFFKIQTNQKGLQLNLNLDSACKNLQIYSDGNKLNGILTNLIKNAIKFTKSGQIEFGVNCESELLVFYVKDTGIGIPISRINAIFERFVQADLTNSRSHEGSGLGLSIVKAYVEMLNGKIWVNSTEGIGSEFYFSIPFKLNCSKEININKIETIDSSTNKEITILIAEDDDISFKYLSSILNNENITIIHVTNGHDAIKQVKNNSSISLILMDIKMPSLNGIEATKSIRLFNKNIPIIAQTAYALAGDKEAAIEAGCTDYITKPVKKKDLLKLIEKYS